MASFQLLYKTIKFEFFHSCARLAQDAAISTLHLLFTLLVFQFRRSELALAIGSGSKQAQTQSQTVKELCAGDPHSISYLHQFLN
jgi:hypothetical protein